MKITATTPATLIYSGLVSNFDINYIDADDGYIALGDQDGQVLLYNTATDKPALYNFGHSIYQVQVLYVNQ